MNGSEWTVTEAKAKLSRVIDQAQSKGPQTITRNGRKAAVIMAIEERKAKTKRQGSLADQRYLHRSEHALEPHIRSLPGRLH